MKTKPTGPRGESESSSSSPGVLTLRQKLALWKERRIMYKAIYEGRLRYVEKCWPEKGQNVSGEANEEEEASS